MKILLNNFLRSIPVYILILHLYGCGSSEDSAKIEAINEIRPDISRSSIEIKEDIKLSVKSAENKFTDKSVVIKIYTIQLGSFKDETNADKVTRKARNILSLDVSSKNIDGLYKVRTGNYSSLENALADLLLVKQAGYNDSYILELVY